MGVSYSSTKLKVQLRTANQRMSMHINKRNNTIRSDSREVAKLLQVRKDESARLKVEGIIASKNMVMCMEILQLMCELVLQRIGIINAAQNNHCPEDLEESIASIVYCSTRIEISELEEMSKLFAAKFGKDYIMSHMNNESGKVSPRIIARLSVRPPDFDTVINLMQEIAGQYEIDWKPDWSHLESGIESNDPYRLGGVAKIAHSSAPVPEPTEDEVKSMPMPTPTYNPQSTGPPVYQPPQQQYPYNPQQQQQQPQNYMNPQFMSVPTPHSTNSHSHSHHHSPSPSPSHNNSRISVSDGQCTCGAIIPVSPVATIIPKETSDEILPQMSPPAYADPPAPIYTDDDDDATDGGKTLSNTSESLTMPSEPGNRPRIPSLADEVDRFEVKKPTESNSSIDRFEAKKPNAGSDEKKDPGEEDDELERRFRALHK